MGSGLTTSELHRLDRACIDLYRAFKTPPYLVGTAFDGDTFRDVDVRTILDDDEFDAIFGTRPQLWGMFCLAVSVTLSEATGLRVDYQVQRMTEANEKHPGPRNPLGQVAHRIVGREFAGLGDATRFARPTTGEPEGPIDNRCPWTGIVVHDCHCHACVPPTGEPEACGATDGEYGTCTLPAGHGRFHREDRDGRLWAEWSGRPRIGIVKGPACLSSHGVGESCEECP